MSGVISTLRDKCYGKTWSFPYNCYEVGHGWTPNCSGAACEVGYSAFKNSLPLYTSLYLFTQCGLQRKFTPSAFAESFKSALTSSSFLGFNFFAGIAVSCILRNNSDRYYYRIQCLLPGFIASYAALLIERPNRRPALAFYLANMSSELAYKLAESQGYAIKLPHSETIIFVLGMGCWLHFVRLHGFGHDPVSTGVKFLIGPHEAKSKARKKPLVVTKLDSEILLQNDDKNDKQLCIANTNKIERKRKNLYQQMDLVVTQILNQFFGSHKACPHDGISCVDYTLKPLVSRFAMGYLIRSMLNVITKGPQLLKTPGSILSRAFTDKSSINFGLFLSSFVAISKSTHCILRRLSDKQENWHSFIAGGLSGLSMLFSPKSTLSTYVLWKCLEQYFFLGVQNNVIKNPDMIICSLYAFSANVLLYTFAIEPRFIRSSYMKFIDKMSDHKLHQVNRMVLDVFGPNASVGYEDWFPDLDPRYMSREFQELVFNWLIQAH